MRTAKTVLAVLLSALISAAIAGCGTYYEYEGGEVGSPAGLESPPPWETGGGVGDFMHYYYYPQVKIYYNLDKDVYYYYYEGQWQVASELPSNVKLSGKRVNINMKEEEPFRWQGEVEKRYPPGAEGEEKK